MVEQTIDWSQPVQVRRGDFSVLEAKRFREATGEELFPFLNWLAVESINIDELSAATLETICTVVWIVLCRQQPSLTLDEVLARGIFEIMTHLAAVQEQLAEPAQPTVVNGTGRAAPPRAPRRTVPAKPQ